MLQQVTEGVRAAVFACGKKSTNSERRIVEVNPFANFFSKALATGGINSSPMKAALEKNGFKGCKDDDLEPVFKYLEFCLKQVDEFKMALKTVDVTFQNLDSSEISLTDVSHYYDSDPTKVVSSLRDDKKKPSSFMADTTTANAHEVRTLSETVRLDARTKLRGYAGLRLRRHPRDHEAAAEHHGWAATAGEVDNFIFEDANDVFIKDEEMRDRLMNLNPNAFRDTVTTFLEANGRGYWETSDENMELLQDLYQEVEDKIEGV
ncbi:unnamed protein product [Ascophyllum nodosum]